MESAAKGRATPPAQELKELSDIAGQLSLFTQTFVPDFYPLAKDGLPTDVKEPLDFRADFEQLLSDLQRLEAGNPHPNDTEEWKKIREAFKTVQDFLDKHGAFGGPDVAKLRDARDKLARRLRPHDSGDALVAQLIARLGGEAALGGFGRLVAILNPRDFAYVGGEEAGAQTYNQKVILLAQLKKYNAFENAFVSYTTVAHELAHTMPFLWSEKQMSAECGRNYHNKTHAVAHGFQVTLGGEEKRERHDSETVMGPITGAKKWIAQCAYWHLIGQFASPPDPRVILIRAELGQNNNAIFGHFFPAYQLNSSVDLQPGEGGSWAIVLRDEGGRQLARFPFEPQWRLPESSRDRRILAVMYRVPEMRGARQIDLVGPSGLLDTLRYSNHAPRVIITSPVNGSIQTSVAGKVHVQWKGEDRDGKRLLYTVLYSYDRGKTWIDQAFEQTGTEYAVRIKPGTKEHRVKVIATNGVRSGDAVADFTVK